MEYLLELLEQHAVMVCSALDGTVVLYAGYRLIHKIRKRHHVQTKNRSYRELFDSELGKGSDFTVYVGLPVAEGDQTLPEEGTLEQKETEKDAFIYNVFCKACRP